MSNLKYQQPIVIHNPNNLILKHEVWVNDDITYNVPRSTKTVTVTDTFCIGSFVSKTLANKAIQKYHAKKQYQQQLESITKQENV